MSGQEQPARAEDSLLLQEAQLDRDEPDLLAARDCQCE